MNILITGSKGQLGSELQKIAATDQKHTWFFTDVDELNITNKEAVDFYFQHNSIEACVNCAAYTAVDKAEDEPEKAMLINAKAVEILADACFASNSLLLHVSTDYVFAGNHYKPYEEDHPIEPQSAYGRTKAAGEILLSNHPCKSIIVRTSWLYSAVGVNFVKTMLRLGSEKESINVIYDQAGTPTWAFDLAWALVLMLDSTPQEYIKQVYHFSNEGIISWYDFATEIMEISGLQCKVNPIPSSAWPVRTPRPHYSVLSKEKFKADFKVGIPHWKHSLKKCIAEINGQKQP